MTELSTYDALHAAASVLKEHDKPFEIVIRGHCMEPVLLDGERVLVTPGARLRAGDIIVFLSCSGGFTSHRLLGRTVTTRGARWMSRPDNSAMIDGLLIREQIIGKVTRNLSRRTEVHTGGVRRLLSRVALLQNILAMGLRKLTVSER